MHNIKSKFRFVDEVQKAKFSQSHCLLTISVGQGSHEEERFAATLELINASFNACTITLHDGLQRYTMALDKKEDPSYFYEISVKEGDFWLERNKKYYSKLTILKDIIRWGRWLSHPDFPVERNKILTLINQDTLYKKVFDETIDEYLSRYFKRLTDVASFDLERARRLCFDYLVEECAVLCLWVETGCQFELYPGKHNAAVNETRKRFVFSNNPDLLYSVGIGFNQRKDLPPQRFTLLKNQQELSLAEET
jgi:hypothetical protein